MAITLATLLTPTDSKSNSSPPDDGIAHAQRDVLAWNDRLRASTDVKERSLAPTKVRRYLSELARETVKVVSSLPEGVDGTVRVRDHYVYLIIQGRRLAAFTLVLGSESPEVVYDGRYIPYDGIPPGTEDQIDFAKEAADNIVEFLLSDRIPVERKNRILDRPYLSIPMADGVGWSLKKFG